MKLSEIKEMLCSYDKRNPNFIEGEKTENLFCDNCFSGRDQLANMLLKARTTKKFMTINVNRAISSGSTYHIVEVFINNEKIIKSKITYGYDDHFFNTAAKLLVETKNRLIPKELKEPRDKTKCLDDAEQRLINYFYENKGILFKNDIKWSELKQYEKRV